MTIKISKQIAEAIEGWVEINMNSCFNDREDSLHHLVIEHASIILEGESWKDYSYGKFTQMDYLDPYDMLKIAVLGYEIEK